MQITVNGEKIPSQVYHSELEKIKQQNPGIPDEIATEQVQNHIIDWTIIRQEAKKEDIPVMPVEIDNEFEKLCESHGGKDAFFKRFGMSEQNEGHIKGDIELNIKTQRFLDQITEDAAEPTPAHIVDFYEKNKARYIKPEQAHVLHIVKHPKNEMEAQKAASELRELRQQLLDGADFMELANKHSELTDGTTPDLGMVVRGHIAPAFDYVVFSMNVGEISPVFQTQFGLHIATVVDMKPPSQLTLEECEKDITDRLVQGYKNTIVSNWVKEKKENAEIEIKES